MYDFDSAKRAYHNDPLFKQIVEQMCNAIHQLQLTPADLRAAAHYACYLHEMRYPRPVLLCPVCRPGRPCVMHQDYGRTNVEPAPG